MGINTMVFFLPVSLVLLFLFHGLDPQRCLPSLINERLETDVNGFNDLISSFMSFVGYEARDIIEDLPAAIFKF